MIQKLIKVRSEYYVIVLTLALGVLVFIPSEAQEKPVNNEVNKVVALEEVVVVAYLDVKPALKALLLDEVILVGYGGQSSKRESKKSESSGSKSHPGTPNEIEENRE